MNDVTVVFTMTNKNTITWDLNKRQWNALETFLVQGGKILFVDEGKTTYYVVVENVVSFVVTKNYLDSE